MSVRSAIEAGRAANLQTLIDTCVVTRVVGKVFDPETDTYSDVLETVYTGSCRVKPWMAGYDQQAGEQSVTTKSYDVRFPADSVGLKVNDTLSLTESFDADLLGRPLTITSVELASARTAKHVVAEDRS